MEEGLLAPPTFQVRRRRPQSTTEAGGSAVMATTVPFLDERPHDVEKTGNVQNDRALTIEHHKIFTYTVLLTLGLSIVLTLAITSVN